jgi:sugar porter (SP) family MFS transporter
MNSQDGHKKKTKEGGGPEEMTTAPLTITRATFTFVACASLNSCNLGFDIGVSTEAGRLIQNDLGLSRKLVCQQNLPPTDNDFSSLAHLHTYTEFERELFIGSLNFWAIWGALSSQAVSDSFGRRTTFVIAAVGFLIGIFIMIMSHSLQTLMVGRAFVGWGIGVGLSIDPLYISEVSPPQSRGSLVTYSEIAINVGLVFGFSTSLFLSGLNDSMEWRVMFLLGAIMPLLLIIVVFKVMPESPRWLVQRGRHDEARNVLEMIYPEGFDVTPVLESIKEAIQRDSSTNMALGWSFLWRPSPAVFRMLLVGVGAPVAQQMVGIDAIQYYLVDVIARSGIDSKEGQSLVLILMGMIKLGFVFVGGKTFDSAGRRIGLGISLFGMGGSLLLVSIAYLIMDEDIREDLSSTKATIAVLSGICLYLSFFSIGMGPGAWLIPSEVFSNVIRAKSMSLAAFASRVYATVMASTFLSVANAIGYSGFFFLLSVTCFVLLVLMWMYLPETMGRSLEDMTAYFAEVTNDNTLLEAEQELVDLRPSKRTTERGMTASSEFSDGDGEEDGLDRSDEEKSDPSEKALPPVV